MITKSPCGHDLSTFLFKNGKRQCILIPAFFKGPLLWCLECGWIEIDAKTFDKLKEIGWQPPKNYKEC